MSRRSATTSAKDKDKKLSKKEKRRLAELKRQEEERKRLEEEERQRQEEERQRRIREEQERQRQEQERIRREIERKRIFQEKVAFDQNKSDRVWRLERRLKDLETIAEQRDIAEVNLLPSADDHKELRAYLSFWEESLRADSESEICNIDEFITEAQNGISLLRNALEKHAIHCARGSIERASAISQSMSHLSDITLITLDRVTAHVMQFSDEFLKNEHFFYSKTDDINFGLWINPKNPRLKVVEFSEIKISNELSLKGMALSPIAIRAMQFTVDILAPRVIVHSKFQPVGGIVLLEILSIPPPLKENKGWKIRQSTHMAKEVVRQPYAQQDSLGRYEPPPCRVTFVIPAHVIIRKDPPRAAWWDNCSKAWKTDGVTDVSFDAESRRLSFQTTHLSTAVALVHSRVFDMPFASWFLYPLEHIGRKTAVFSISTRSRGNESDIGNVVFLIHNDMCRLVTPNHPELDHLREFMHPIVLLMKLAQCGINLLCEDSDAQYLHDVQPKISELEEKVYSEMSYMSTTCTLMSSRWNQNRRVGQERAVFRVATQMVDPLRMREDDDRILSLSDAEINFNFESVPFDDDSKCLTVLYDVEKCGIVDCGDNSEAWSEQINEKLDTHLNLYLTLAEVHGTDFVEKRVDAGDIMLSETIRQMLCAVRPLSWG